MQLQDFEKRAQPRRHRAAFQGLARPAQDVGVVWRGNSDDRHDGVEKEVQFGLKSLLDLLDAQQDVVSAEQSLIKARGDYVLAGYALLMHMGKLNADTFGLTPAFVSVDALPIHDIPFSGIIPRVTYPE